MKPFNLIIKIYNKGLFNSFLLINEIFLRKIGISLYTYLKKDEFDKNVKHNSSKDQFTYIYNFNSWGSQESISGKGSEKQFTSKYIDQLDIFFRKYKISSIFDAPCGDLNWMSKVMNNNKLDYIGGDIVNEIIQKNKKKYNHLKFINFDITKNLFPYADVWHCRDCFFHLSYNDIIKSLKNFTNSKIKYALITNHSGLIFQNVDIKTGGFRYLDLRKKPFNFEDSNYQIKDFKILRDFPRYVCLWEREKIKEFLKKIDI